MNVINRRNRALLYFLFLTISCAIFGAIAAGLVAVSGALPSVPESTRTEILLATLVGVCTGAVVHILLWATMQDITHEPANF